MTKDGKQWLHMVETSNVSDMLKLAGQISDCLNCKYFEYHRYKPMMRAARCCYNSNYGVNLAQHVTQAASNRPAACPKLPANERMNSMREARLERLTEQLCNHEAKIKYYQSRAESLKQEIEKLSEEAAYGTTDEEM